MNEITGLLFVKKYFPNDSEQILSMSVDGEEKSLNNNIPASSQIVDFHSLADYTGARVMAISTTALMLVSAELLFPKVIFSVEHSYSRGFYCVPQDKQQLPDNYINQIIEQMKLIVNENVKFKEEKLSIAEVIKLNKGRFKIFEDVSFDKIRINKINDFTHWFLSPLVPSSSYIKSFNLQSFEDGFILQFLNTTNILKLPKIHKLPKLFKVFRESEKVGEILSIKFVDQLNKKIKNDKERLDTIQLYEALHEKKIGKIADIISQDHVKVIFISGPSSSGKTTFMKRLNIQLKINDIYPINISLDDYFVERVETPKDENGEYDYEHFNALNHKLITEHFNKLLSGESIYLPKFDFENGKSIKSEKKIWMGNKSILLVEGIHGLNPKLLKNIDKTKILRIYVSTLTQLNLNISNRVSTSDTRLLRRMVRDKQFRNYSVEETLKRWPSVRAGEERWIFPFQENADIIFNSALEYEWNVFRPKLEVDLKQMDIASPVKNDAVRLCQLLKLYLPVSDEYIPPTSILREYIGKSYFKY
ncbi:MAG: nucleoside kinase [Candidatus Marinimicrobia bacterium]|nr:nucleoside kinase [Candidatus Neomarinimicrobiota bacterium]